MEGYLMKLKLGIFTLLSVLFISTNPVLAKSVREITSTQDLQQLLKTEKNIVIKFSTEQCPYCLYLDSVFKTAAQHYQGPVVFASVMIPSDPNIRDWYKNTFKFATVPTVVYYKDGEKKLVHGSGDKKITDRDILNNVRTIYSI